MKQKHKCEWMSKVGRPDCWYEIRFPDVQLKMDIKNKYGSIQMNLKWAREHWRQNQVPHSFFPLRYIWKAIYFLFSFKSWIANATIWIKFKVLWQDYHSVTVVHVSGASVLVLCHNDTSIIKIAQPIQKLLKKEVFPWQIRIVEIEKWSKKGSKNSAL